jgi:hypothetical protein
MTITTGNEPKGLSGGTRMAKGFNPGGEKGKLHRAIGVPEGEKIPAKKLAAAEHSKNRGVRDMAIRAKTMKGWHHGAHAHHPPARR